MTEETPFNPCSRKGQIRAEIATTLLTAMHSQGLNALIARSADFYGPGAARTGVPNLLVFENLKKGKKAQWLGNPDVPHSYTYVPDAAAALYLLANRPESFGQTWHLPTASAPLTGRQFIDDAAEAMQRPSSFRTINTTMMRLAGLFDRTISELAEMNYQNTAPYVFNSDKFNRTFNYASTPYVDGIRATAKEYETSK